MTEKGVNTYSLMWNLYSLHEENYDNLFLHYQYVGSIWLSL